MAERDPFEDLRLPQVPLAVDPAFAARLRARIEAALHPTTPPTEHPGQETTMSDTSAEVRSALVPYLAVAGAAAAMDWYRDVLGAIETTRFVGDDGRIGHAEMTIGAAKIMLSDEYPEIGVKGPLTLGGSPVMLHLEVVDVDHTHRQAVDAGATSLRPPGDQGHGNRNATIVDPFGHRWMISQPIDADRTATAEAAGTGTGGFTASGRPPAEPGYITMHMADPARGEAFFSELFSWQVERGGQGGGHIANTKFPMGITGENDEGRAVTLYFRVDDIEPFAAKVEELGGRVLARNDYESGGNAECEDDQGYRFDLFKPAPGY